MGEPDSQAGRVLGGRFRLESLLGEGGFGTIWRAEQLILGAPVAIKLIDLSIARQAGAIERFLREAQAAAALRSPHVLQILDYGIEGDQPFIAMELLEGENLAQRIHRVGRLAPSEALRIVTHVARAISRAHECNIVHRDLKPENVFLVRNEDDEMAKVLDFGVEKMKSPIIIDESTQTRTGSLIGTPHYMSPEQVQGNKTVDFRSDIWAIGVIAFEMFTGQRPFTGNALGDLVLQICVREVVKPSQLAPVPVGFDEWYAHAANRDPEQRFQSARDLAQALREVVGGSDRDTSLVISENPIEPSQHDTSSVSAIVRSESAVVSPRVPAESLELAATIFSPATPTPTPVDGPSVGKPSQAKLVTAVIAAVLGLGAVAFGIWYQSAKKGALSTTSALHASARPSTEPATSTSASAAALISRAIVPAPNSGSSTRERAPLAPKRHSVSASAAKPGKPKPANSATSSKPSAASAQAEPALPPPAAPLPAPALPAPTLAPTPDNP